ncbi:hypothetical protein LNTAR_24888 [Lentisphaera araneosa HTCC2155]|jgi:hypothetical protein|uniref:Uncharacterized protein n=1 Tax=Lentisphaera araneosa HTCC2155 TaxID=313628 RepID=A6DSY5_9BACT|nr:hypothetical protein [Lentisphaera araneosa]EDM25275.1 hypothetical protein LNTAR_24888 [Lentisphaera araneosa HTCC2155]
MTIPQATREFETEIEPFEVLKEKIISLGLTIKVTAITTKETLENQEKSQSYDGTISYKNIQMHFQHLENAFYHEGVKTSVFVVHDYNSNDLYVDNEITEQLSKIMTIAPIVDLENYTISLKDKLFFIISGILIFLIIGFSLYGLYKFFE